MIATNRRCHEARQPATGRRVPPREGLYQPAASREKEGQRRSGGARIFRRRHPQRDVRFRRAGRTKAMQTTPADRLPVDRVRRGLHRRLAERELPTRRRQAHTGKLAVCNGRAVGRFGDASAPLFQLSVARFRFLQRRHVVDVNHLAAQYDPGAIHGDPGDCRGAAGASSAIFRFRLVAECRPFAVDHDRAVYFRRGRNRRKSGARLHSPSVPVVVERADRRGGVRRDRRGCRLRLRLPTV